jgi:hypothetical protein
LCPEYASLKPRQPTDYPLRLHAHPPTFGALNIDVTKFWTVSLHMKPRLDTEMIDFMCQENNKDMERMVR